MRLAHLHIPRLIPYTHSLALQNALLARHFRYKDVVRSVGRSGHGAGRENGQDCPDAAAHGAQDAPVASPPDPTLLTFSTLPTYTVGRRHLQSNPISASQQAFLTSNGLASFHASPRGGLLTYHAPGQLTGYVVADLRRHGITARCWVKLLEDSVMCTCAAWGVETTRTAEPGVWIRDGATRRGARTAEFQAAEAEQACSSCSSFPNGDGPQTSDRKICALGVQVSRGITSHGIGLNVFDAALASPPYDFTPAQTSSPSYSPATRGYLSWGFSRIVACGLEGKSVTWLSRELERGFGDETTDPTIDTAPSLAGVADVFAQELTRGLNSMRAKGKESVEGIYRVDEADVLTDVAGLPEGEQGG